jgi:hypothetical protein
MMAMSWDDDIHLLTSLLGHEQGEFNLDFDSINRSGGVNVECEYCLVEKHWLFALYEIKVYTNVSAEDMSCVHF